MLETKYNYEHAPLYECLPENCIRLLKILSENQKGEICCEIEPRTLDEHIKFVALSYKWGSEPSDCVIILNGQPMYVRKNLWRFLRQARALSPDMSDWFWIDAVCINQSNMSERMQQVRLMPKIYSKARQVVAWLGPSYSGSDEAMKYLARPATYWQTKKNFDRIWVKPVGAAIRGICTRSYWTRLWIFQELKLAQRIALMCGDKVISWDSFQNFIFEVQSSAPGSRLQDVLDYEAVSSSPAVSISKQISERHAQTTLWNLMLVTQHLRCSEVRDKVYALLGVAEAGHAGISPDYDMPVPTLLNLVLKAEHEHRSPQSIEEIETQCQQLTALSGQQSGSIFSLVGREGQFPVPSATEMATPILGPQESSINLWWASYYGHHAVQELLFDSGSFDSREALASAAKNENKTAILLLLQTDRIEVNAEDSNGWTPLHQAAVRGHETIVKLLLETGLVDINQEDKLFGWTAFMMAVNRGHIAVIKQLLDTGHVEINAKLGKGAIPQWTAIQIATMNGNEAVVKLLLDTKQVELDLSCKDPSKGETALQLAVEGGHEGIVQLLLDAGQDGPSQTASSDSTPPLGSAHEVSEGVT